MCKLFNLLNKIVSGPTMQALLLTAGFSLPVQAAELVKVIDYESGNMHGLRCADFHSCPTVVTAPVANGKYAGSYILEVDMSRRVKRTESVLMGRFGTFKHGEEYWLGMNYRFEDWAKDRNAEAAPFQIHTRPSSWKCELGVSAVSTAPFLMLVADDTVKFHTYTGVAPWTWPIEKKKWQNIVIHFRISKQDDGFIEVWRDGVRLGIQEGQNSHPTDKCGQPMLDPFLKIGVYKWTWKKKTTDSSRRELLIDDLKIAKGPDGYALVKSDTPDAATTAESDSAGDFDFFFELFE